MIETRIEIAASPSKIRDILLDFSKYPEWHTDFVSHIEPVNTAQLSHFLGPGDELKCDIYGTKFNAVIKENSETLFQWQGPPMYGIAGLHSFYIEPAGNGISTSFRHKEEFSGPLGFLMSPYLLGRMLLMGKMRGFNQDLKVRAES